VPEPIPSALVEFDEIGALGDLALARLARRRRALAQGGGRLGGLAGFSVMLVFLAIGVPIQAGC
jgi:hypothetical protein